MHYPYEEDIAGELSIEHLTGKASERLLASEEVVSLAKEVLTEHQYLEAEELAKKLVGKKAEKVYARARLMDIVKPPPKRPIYYTQWEIQFLPHHTRDIMRDLGDFIDMLVKAAIYEKTKKDSIFHSSLGPAIDGFERCRPESKQLAEILRKYNRFLYRDAKHDFRLPKGRKEHRFTSREAVLTIFITMNLADRIISISPMAERVRQDKYM
ncbi:hypothetical protein ACFLXU_01650 [Chloroflexota bacterium]